ncbi:MAG: hypothetical protein GMKNLPBB_02179 [Myxococcota bacterium]|nr:hypothetical protein [Myxococcota bacterium]
MFTLRHLSALALLASALFLGCSSDPKQEPVDGSTPGAQDTGTPPDTGASSGSDGATPGDSGGDDAATDPDGGGQACLFPGDCPKRFDCEKGQCVRVTACNSVNDCKDEDRTCFNNACVKVCQTDADCPVNGECYNGACRPYPDMWTGKAPPSGQRGKIKAGVGVTNYDFPVGVSMAGYGGRKGAKTPYQVTLGGSDRVFERQEAKVLAIENGEDTVIFLRIPACWTSDDTVSMIALKVQEATGVNYVDKIVTDAPHSHSQPARYWNLVPGKGFSVFGYDDYNRDLHQRYVNSMADAVIMALKNMKPAKFGYGVKKDFDPDDLIFSDRRGENPKLKDNTLTVLRVDDAASSQPMAVIVNFGMHATHFGETWVTGDAAGGAEVETEIGLAAKYGKRVPVLFANGSGGDQSPRGDDRGHANPGKIQLLGRRTMEHVTGLMDSITTADEMSLEVVSRRIPIRYDKLYKEGEYFDKAGVTPGRPYHFGAFQCVVKPKEKEGEYYVDGNLSCAFAIQFLFRAPVPQFQKTRLSAVRMNDLVISTLPGEPHASLGLKLIEDVKTSGAKHAIVFGYSQDHHFYLMEKMDYLRGGYEPSMDIWGYNFGDYIRTEAALLAKQLFTSDKEKNDTGIKPTYWRETDILDQKTVAPTKGSVPAGQVAADMKDSIERLELAEFSWSGGHPGVDLPIVRLERKDGAGFVEHTRKGGLPAIGWGFDSVLIYKGDYEKNHTWAVEWERLEDFPEGAYRIAVEGKEWDGAAAKPYKVMSKEFVVKPSSKMRVREVKESGGKLTLHINYADGPEVISGKKGFLLRSVHNPDAYGAMVPEDRDLTLTITRDGKSQTFEKLKGKRASINAPGTRGGLVTTRVEVDSPGKGELTIKVMDSLGNSGEEKVKVE